MTERVTFDEAPGLSGSPGQIVARIGVSSLGVTGDVHEYAGGQDGLVADTLGYGPLAAATRRGLRYGEQTAFAAPSAVDTPGTIGSVTQTGGGPTVTAAAVPADGDQIDGPWFAFPNLTVRIKTAGALGVARAELLLDGATPGDDTIDIPPALPASITGTVDITALDSSELAALNTQTFIADPDTVGPFTTTFTSVDEYQDIIDQIGNSMKAAATLLGSADLTSYTPGNINGKELIFTNINGDETGVSVLFSGVTTLANIATQIAAVAGLTATLATGDFIRITSDVLGETSRITIGNGNANADLGFTNAQTDVGEQYGTASLVGGKYLRITGASPGATGTVDIGTGTANNDLGFTDNDSAAGTNSTYDVPGVGVRLTFPSGDYEEGTEYALATTAPSMSIAGMLAAAQALRDSADAFSILHIAHEPADGLDLLAWQSALQELVDGWATAEDNPIFVKWIIGGPLGAPGEPGDLTASRAAWATNDQDVKTNLVGTQDATKFNTIVHGDVYLEWLEYSGRHRAQLATCYVEECARYPMNVNPGLGSKGALRAAYLKGIDGAPARTEANATVKMQDSGFSVLRDDGGLPYIRAGRTRAPSTSQLTGEHTARTALECGRVMRERAFAYTNATPALNAQGQLAPVDKANVEGAFNNDLRERILKPGYASSASASALGIESVGGTDKLFVKGIFQRLANITDVAITVYVTDKLSIVEGSGG